MLKDAARFTLDLLRNRVYLPAHAWAYLWRRQPTASNLCQGSVEEHLHAAMEWICSAYRAAGKQGVAARYTLKDGWVSPYPETTGYIIPTLYAYSEFTGEGQYAEVAYDLAEWLLAIQMESGAYPGGHLDQGRGPVVFNTGQILIGLLEAARRTREARFESAAFRAGEWLTQDIDDDGAWRRCTYKDRFHAYHTRVAWPLVDAGLMFHEERFVEAGRANLDFAITLQKENGWFAHNTLDEEEVPFTHTLAYVARGLLEAGLLLDEEKYIDSADRMARAMLDDFEKRGFLAGQYDENMNAIDTFSCLTGCAQISIVWQKLFAAGKGGPNYITGACTINRQVMHCQNLHTNHPGIRGGVPGSWPIDGAYIRFGYPNWAAKFLADALMLELE